MSSAPIQSDLMLWSMLRTRRRSVRMLKGMDATANRWIARIRHARRGLGYLRREARAVVALEPEFTGMSDAALDAEVATLRDIFALRRQQRSHVRRGFAAVREIAWRESGERPYEVQLMGALGLWEGQIVEMVTGEGKTLTATIAAAMLGWQRKPVHVVTVNDYLAQRDADSRAPIFRRMGLSVGAVVGEMPPPRRLDVYRRSIVYATAKEVMADWLRDRLRLGRITDPVSTRWNDPRIWADEGPGAPGSTAGRHPGAGLPGAGGAGVPGVMVPGLFAAVVDEIDAILIDEAVTPLIIANDRGDNPQGPLYARAAEVARAMVRREHFTLKPEDRQADLTAAGRRFLREQVRDDDHPLIRAPRRGEEMVAQALVALHCYRHGEHYQVIDQKVVIVDEFTGRIMQDRQWQHGLHQAVEAKEGVPVTADRETLASISFQRFFRQYPHLCGMTGTAAEAKPEMERTYGLPVRVIPTHRPIRRTRMAQRVFATARARWDAVGRSIAEVHASGRPVLVGTRSVEASERVSAMLKEQGLEHTVLNAIFHQAEAQVIARAGEPGAVTVATNMAGRGTDIKLGKGVADLGGLHVLLTERHTARRIDRQFIGRSGRQGDPGSSQTFASLEDDLVVKHLGLLGRNARQFLLRWWLRKTRGNDGPMPAWIDALFALAQRRATTRALKNRLMLIRHEDELDKSLPGGG